MKKLIGYLLIGVSLITISSCKKDPPKKQGCTDANALTYDATAQENNGTCTYLSGTYACNETSSVGTDHYNITVIGDNTFSVTNFANQFDGITGYRSGLSIGFNVKFNIPDHNGHTWDFDGGSGSVSSSGKILNYTFVIDDISHGNNFGTINVSVNATK